MKTEIRQNEEDALMATIKSEASRAYLKQILSPLEIAAITNNYKLFNYEFNGITLKISNRVCMQLLTMTRQKVQFFTSIIYKETLSKGQNGPLLKFLDEPLNNLPLPEYLKNRLRGLKCYSMFDVVERGRYKIMHSRGFGKRAMQILDALFKKHRCSNLFE